MILTVGNVKGGVGKSTLAVNFAIALSALGGDILLIDGDPQATAATFTELRTQEKGEAGYTMVMLQGSAIRTQVRQLSPKYSHIVIDVGGRDTGSLRAALTVSDVVLVPVKPRSFDLWSVEQTAELIREARELNSNLRAIGVLNEADSRGKDNEAALEVLKETDGLETAPLQIVSRKAFPNAAAAGLSVTEYTDMKAREEFTLLLQHLFVYTNDTGVIDNGNR